MKRSFKVFLEDLPTNVLTCEGALKLKAVEQNNDIATAHYVEKNLSSFVIKGAVLQDECASFDEKYTIYFRITDNHGEELFVLLSPLISSKASLHENLNDLDRTNFIAVEIIQTEVIIIDVGKPSLCRLNGGSRIL